MSVASDSGPSFDFTSLDGKLHLSTMNYFGSLADLSQFLLDDVAELDPSLSNGFRILYEREVTHEHEAVQHNLRLSNYIFSSICRFLLRYETRVGTVGKGVHLNLSK